VSVKWLAVKKFNFKNSKMTETTAIYKIDKLQYLMMGWLGSRVVSVLDSGVEGPGFKSQSKANCSHPSCLCSLSSKIGSSPLKGCGGGRVTAGLAYSNSSLPPGLWLTSPAGWLPRTGISSGTLRSYEYGEWGYLYLFTWWCTAGISGVSAVRHLGFLKRNF